MCGTCSSSRRHNNHNLFKFFGVHKTNELVVTSEKLTTILAGQVTSSLEPDVTRGPPVGSCCPRQLSAGGTNLILRPDPFTLHNYAILSYIPVYRTRLSRLREAKVCGIDLVLQ
jgi:hypothetical protein